MEIATTILVACVILLAMAVVALFALRKRDRDAAALRVEIAHSRSLIERAHQAFAEISADGTLRDWNSQIADLLGYTREEVVGKKLSDIAVPETQRDGFCDVVKRLADPEADITASTTIVLDLIGKSTTLSRIELLPVSMKLWVAPSHGERRLGVLVQDLTAEHAIIRQKEAMISREQQLVQDLKSSEQARGEFVATVAHELRTPLTSIVGYVEMLSDGYGGKLTDNQREMLGAIDRNSQRVLALIDDVLTLTRVESRVAKLHPSMIKPEDLLTGVQQAMYPVVSQKGLWCEIDVPPDTPTFEADYSQIERVLLNTVTNSSKFTPEGGTITLSASHDDDNVYLRVTDTGSGIPEADLERVSAKFYRTSSSMAQGVKGSGLGLAIVKSIVERHKGDLKIDSKVEVGTTVTVRIPRVFIGNDTALS